MASITREFENPTVRSTALRWVKQLGLIFAIWTGVGLLVASQWYILALESHHPRAWRDVLIPSLLTRWIFALLTPGVLWISSRFPLGRGNWLRNLAIHALGAFGFLVLWVSLRFLLYPITDLMSGRRMSPSWELFHNMVAQDAYYNFWMYGSIVAVSQLWEYYRKYRERELCALRLEAELTQAQLKVMRMQLDPQFLFATLDSISTLMHHDVEAADDLIVHLSDLLRMRLAVMDKPELTLMRELDFLKVYLEIQQACLGGQLTVEMSFQPDSLDAMVPGMILPSLVENAIQHGIGRVNQPERIEIRSEVRQGKLRIEILDDVPWPTPSAPPEVETRLASAKLRIEQLYRDSHLSAREIVAEGGSRVTLEMPFKAERRDPAETPEIQAVFGEG
jgi:two-component system LytT family sensor kinase